MHQLLLLKDRSVQAVLQDILDIATGEAEKGAWVCLHYPPIEGRLTNGLEGIDVGHRVCVQLLNTVVERGYIDFGRIGEG